jgi:hypothetical protein
MMGDKKVGDFVVEDSGRKFQIELNDDYSNDYRMMKLWALAKDRVIDDAGVRFWMSRRVMQKDRVNGRSVLQAKGLKQCGVFSIFRSNYGATYTDYNWVRFEEGLTFQDVRSADAKKCLAFVSDCN